jgi:hypothetical protein
MEPRDAAGHLFQELERDGYQKLVAWVAEHKEESVHLDFKTKTNPGGAGIGDDDRENLRKAVSGFSNAAGGVVVWGVKTGKGDADYATELVPITNHRGFLSNLNGLVPGIALPNNPGLRLLAIDDNEKPDQGFVAVYVPFSERPVRAEGSKDKNFYRRTTDNFIPMTVYDIEEMYGRRLGVVAVPVYRVASHGHTGGQAEGARGETHCAIDIGVRNIGRTIAKFPFVIVEDHLGTRINQYGTSGNGPSEIPVHAVGSRRRYLGGSDTVVHPGLELFGPRFDVSIPHIYRDGKYVPDGAIPTVTVTFLCGCEGQIARRVKLELTSDAIKAGLLDRQAHEIKEWSFLLP